MSELMSPMEEARIVKGVESAIKLANAGLKPNEALAKVAQTEKFGAEVIKRMVTAYNNSKTLSVMQKKGTVEGQDLDFELADPLTVLKSVYPDQVKTAAVSMRTSLVPSFYNDTPRTNFNRKATLSESLPQVKSAGYAPDLSRTLLRLRGAHQRTRDDLTASNGRYENTKSALFQDIQKLGEYFRQSGHQPFEKVESTALGFWGSGVKPIMNMAWRLSKAATWHEKRGEAPAHPQIVHTDEEPYTLISNILKQAEAGIEAAAERLRLQTKYAEEEAAIKSRLDQLNPFAKSAGGLMDVALGGIAGTTIGKRMNDKPNMIDVIDPDVEENIRNIGAESTLAELMANDEVISTYPREKVTRSFNDISQLAPNIVTQPSIMRTMLRKHLQEGTAMDLHEINQLQSVNKATGQPYFDDVTMKSEFGVNPSSGGGPKD